MKAAAPKLFGPGGRLRRYPLAVLATLAALLLRELLDPLLGDSMVFTFFVVAAAFSAWFLGMGEAIVSALLGGLFASYFFLNPRFDLRFSFPGDRLLLLVYFVSVGLLIAMGETNRRMTKRAQAQEALFRSHAELEDRVRARTAELDRSNRDLRDLSVRLLQVQDEERRNLARELHDSVGQAIAAFMMNLQMVEAEAERLNPRTREALAGALQSAQEISEEVRTLSHLLHPPLFDVVGLKGALQDYVQEFERRSGIQTALEISSLDNRLARDAEFALFRIIQESLVNIHRHSGSRTASIRLEESPGGVLLEIRDEGKGISAEQISQINSGGSVGVGLRGIRERIVNLGGDLKIIHQPRGILIQAVIPLGSPRTPTPD